MNLLLYLAEAVLVAYFARQVAVRLRMPTVTGYVIGGVLLGGSIFFFLPSWRQAIEPYLLSPSTLGRLGLVSEIALGLIAFSIGAELHLTRLKKLGRSIAWIVLLESLGAFFCVTLAVWLFRPGQFHFALMLGAVASATAPAATVAIINQYRSRGPLTTTILAVVGVDDAIALIIYAFASSISRSVLTQTSVNLVSGFLIPCGVVILSLGIGAAVGGLALVFVRKARHPEDLILMIAAVILLTSGLSLQFGLSLLLANMAAAAVIVNRTAFIKHRIQEVFSSIAILFYALFFITGGAHLDLGLVPQIGLLGIVYFISRLVGKVGGAQLGATLGRAGKTVRNNIGFSLIPQVGVAVALALVVGQEFGTGAYGAAGIELATTVINILLFTTILTEILGPYLTRRALINAGEATVTEAVSPQGGTT